MNFSSRQPEIVIRHKYDFMRMSNYAGTLVAFLIGSGFATGQEALQFYAVYGFYGATGAVTLTGVIMVFLSVSITHDANFLKLNRPADLLKYYCGKHVGSAVEVAAFIYLYSLFILMVSGGGAVFREQFGLSKWIASAIIGVSSLAAVLLGLKKIAGILGKIGPLKIAAIVAVCTAALLKRHGELPDADIFLATHATLKAAPTWWVSGVIYPANCAVFMVTFLSAMGASASRAREAIHGAALGAILFSIALTVVSLGILTVIPHVYAMQAPTVGVADIVCPGLGSLYSIIVIICIFTTAVPCLWVSVMSLTTNENSRRFRLIAFCGVIIALVGSQIDFSKLINVIIPLGGWIGMILPVSILFKWIGVRIPGYNTKYNDRTDF